MTKTRASASSSVQVHREGAADAQTEEARVNRNESEMTEATKDAQRRRE